MSGNIPTFTFSSLPTFHRLWEVCMECHLTPSGSSVTELESCLNAHGIDKSSMILDPCCGSGSMDIAFMERGWNITATDGDWGMLEIFRRKLEAQKIKQSLGLVRWEELPLRFGRERFKALMCLGNSLIYAGGYWNGTGRIVREQSLYDIRKVLKTFHGQLAPGGLLLLDKPADDEPETEELVAHACINGHDMYDVFFSVQFDPFHPRRIAQILVRHQKTGIAHGTPNVAYPLKDQELIKLARQAGFASIERLEMSAEHRFPIWVAKK